MLAASSAYAQSNNLVSVWPIIFLSHLISNVNAMSIGHILKMTRQGAAHNAASIHYGPAVQRSMNL